jgi:hypothetical protein
VQQQQQQKQVQQQKKEKEQEENQLNLFKYLHKIFFKTNNTASETNRN